MNEQAQDLIAQLADETSLSQADLLGLATASEADLVMLLEAYKTAGTIADVSTFDRIVAGLKVVAEIAGFVSPVVGLAENLRTVFTGL